MKTKETWGVCQECRQPAKKTEIVYLPDKREDFPWVICQACLDGIYDTGDKVLYGGIKQ